MPKIKIPTDNLEVYAYEHVLRVLSGLDDVQKRKAIAVIESGGACEVRVCMEINTKPCITVVLIDGDCDEHQLHAVGGEPDSERREGGSEV